MLIGIDASRALIKQRTGIEEYSYQVIKHLRDKLDSHQVVLYLCKNQIIDFKLPENWRTKVITWPRFWTQGGLSLEMICHPIDILFVPAHTVPLIHPKNTIATVHGLEYEIFSQGYSFWQRLYMRFSIKLSCRAAKKIIAVSKNTKKDLIDLYKVPEEKIEVIYEGVSGNDKISNFQINTKYQIPDTKYLLFIGRLEKRKNIEGIIEAYKILKEKYNIPHNLVLAGSSGFGYEFIKLKIRNYLKIKNSKLKIIELGYVNDSKKWELLSNADVFLFPSFYEGFGLPILEAQNAGVPVVASNISSIPEVAGDSAAYCDPKEPESIALSVQKILSDRNFRDGIIRKGYENAKRFNWENCADSIAKLLNG